MYMRIDYDSQPGYWGLSKDDEGCKPCGCDIGGSYDNLCDATTGQCNCRPGIKGRACDQATPGYFVTDLDFLRYEAEFATGTGVCYILFNNSDALITCGMALWRSSRAYYKSYLNLLHHRIQSILS